MEASKAWQLAEGSSRGRNPRETTCAVCALREHVTSTRIQRVRPSVVLFNLLHAKRSLLSTKINSHYCCPLGGALPSSDYIQLRCTALGSSECAPRIISYFIIIIPTNQIVIIICCPLGGALLPLVVTSCLHRNSFQLQRHT